jgi:ribosome-associated protein
MRALSIAPGVSLPAADLSVRFTRSRGPGGQNVNKVETTVELRYHLAASGALSDAVKARLRARYRRRITRDGDLVVRSGRFRTQDANRRAAEAQLARLIRAALAPRKPRRPTATPASATRRRLMAKRRRGLRKTERRPVRNADIT